MSGIMARKIGMTRIFNKDGNAVPVTVLEALPCPVIQVKKPETDGYSAVQIGYRIQKESRLSKPHLGHLRRSGVNNILRLHEVPVPMEPKEDVKLGDLITVSIFTPGEKVSVTGPTRGKGFQGVVKRHGFACGDSSHGSKTQRKAGSIGQCATPARVWKNKKMPGRDGGKKVTIRNLEIVRIDPEKNLIIIEGAVPGAKNGYLFVKKQGGK